MVIEIFGHFLPYPAFSRIAEKANQREGAGAAKILQPSNRRPLLGAPAEYSKEGIFRGIAGRFWQIFVFERSEGCVVVLGRETHDVLQVRSQEIFSVRSSLRHGSRRSLTQKSDGVAMSSSLNLQDEQCLHHISGKAMSRDIPAAPVCLIFKHLTDNTG